MNPPCSKSTLWSISLHQGLQFYLLLLSTHDINEWCTFILYLPKWVSMGIFRLRPPLYLPKLCNVHHSVHHMLISFFVFCSNRMDQALHSGIQWLCSTLLHYSIILMDLPAILKTATLSDGTSHRENEIPVLPWLEVITQFSLSSQFANQHYV